MKELMLSLLLWIGANSSLPTERVILPQVKFISSEEMSQIFNVNVDCSDTTVKALYHIKNKIIYLHEDWDQSNLIDRSFLLHELVHHRQRKEGYECREKKEKEAYELQFKYLRENDVKDPKKVLNIGDLFYVIITSCEIIW